MPTDSRAITRTLPTHTWQAKIAVVAVVLLPVFLFHARAFADACVSLTAVLFLIESARCRVWHWLRRPWLIAALLLWACIVIGSLQNGPQASINQALVVGRLFLFAAALEEWVLPQEQAQRWLTISLRVMAVWLVSQVWEQRLLGSNILGDPAWPDGMLTGPFIKPRAGPVFIGLFIPAVLPPVLDLLKRGDRRGFFYGSAILVISLATLIMIGQRMPTLLALFGICIAALIERRLRLPALITAGLGVVLLAALPVLSPATYFRVVQLFVQQITHFAEDPYGQLYTRATEMMLAHPWFGVGYDGFRYLCNDPQYMHGLRAYGIPTALVQNAGGCNLHPHNYYFQILAAGGLLGMAAFLVMVVAVLRRLARLTGSDVPNQQRMLFVAVCVAFWPLASTLSMFVLDAGGWIFLFMGWGLAATRKP